MVANADANILYSTILKCCHLPLSDQQTWLQLDLQTIRFNLLCLNWACYWSYVLYCFEQDQFFDYMIQQAIKTDCKIILDNKSKFVLVHASSGFKHSLKGDF